jgi:hypothetical protein
MTGSEAPGYHTNFPFSSKKPFKEEQPGPPFNHIVISSTGSPIFGWKTKNSSLDESAVLIGTRPEYISPISNGTSGKDLTWNAADVSEFPSP